MEKRTITTDRAPAAIGPYSQAVAAGSLLFVSGQIPLDPVTGQVVDGGFAAQARRVLDNFLAVVEAAGLTPEHVVRTTVYLTDLSRFQEFNALYAERFGSSPPARAVVQVCALPRGVEIEMDGIAAFPG
jgi:2-iminobutanoate/2-iminopropanoate deaminase